MTFKILDRDTDKEMGIFTVIDGDFPFRLTHTDGSYIDTNSFEYMVERIGEGRKVKLVQVTA